MAEGDAEEAKKTQEKSEAEPSPDTKPKKRAPKAKPDKTEGAPDSTKQIKAESEKTTPPVAEQNKKTKAEPEVAAEPAKIDDSKEKPEQNKEASAKEKKPKPQKPKQDAEAKKAKTEGEQKKEEPKEGVPQKKGLFSKLSEKLKKHPTDAEKKEGETKPQGDAAEKKEAVAGGAADKKEGFFKRLFKKKPPEEEPQINLAPTIISDSSAPAESQAQQQERPVAATVAPVPQETFFHKLKQLFKKELPLPIEIPTHCAVCGIDLHTVYSYTCTNCRKIACYYCMRSFNEKTYCTKCLKEKGIL